MGSAPISIPVRRKSPVDSQTQTGAIMKELVFSNTTPLAAAIRAGHISVTAMFFRVSLTDPLEAEV
jgi:hypothetical protein